jgi:hypothetical protein
MWSRIEQRFTNAPPWAGTTFGKLLEKQEDPFDDDFTTAYLLDFSPDFGEKGIYPSANIIP